MARIMVNYSANYQDNIDVNESYDEVRELLLGNKQSHVELTVYGGSKTLFNRERIISVNVGPVHELSAAELDARDNILVKNTGTGEQLPKQMNALSTPQTEMM